MHRLALLGWVFAAGCASTLPSKDGETSTTQGSNTDTALTLSTARHCARHARHALSARWWDRAVVLAPPPTPTPSRRTPPAAR